MTNTSQNPAIFLLGKLWEYSGENKKRVVFYYSCYVFAAIFSFLEPLAIGMMINTFQEIGFTQGAWPILKWLVAWILLGVLFWVFHGPARVIETTNAFLVRANYKMHLLEGTMDLPINWHSGHHSGDTIDKIEKGSQALGDFSKSSYSIIYSLFKLISSYLVLVYFNIHAIYIVPFFVLIIFSIIIKFDKKLIPMYKEVHRADNRTSAKVFDIISNITTVIILRIEDLVSKAMKLKIMYPYALYVKTKIREEIKWSLASLMSHAIIFLVLISLFFPAYTSGEVLLIGNIFIVYQYLERLKDVFFNFASKYSEIVNQRTKVMNAQILSNEFKNKNKKRKININHWKELKIENLNFSYHEKKGLDLHLSDINMLIKRRQRVALIGESGSGKTTFLKVFRELYPFDKGTIKLNDQKLKGLKEISEHISLIPQDPEIFNSTIKENITMGVGHNIKTIKKYTNMAKFTGVVNKLPNKWNSSINEKGVNLSGGQKQRLALARGLLASQDKEFILLDEPTSSVDPKNEIMIYNNIFKNFKDKTVISSVHRMHLLPLFDNIYYFDKGKIIASGSFDELLKNSKPFQKAWKKYSLSEN